MVTDQASSLPPLAGSIIEAIGNTPLLDAHRLVRARGLDGRLLLKLEYLNPGGSKKDRIALAMVRAAKADGSLRDAQPVIELTSGNTGAGLAIVCGALGHPFIAVMSRGNSVERRRQIAALGAEVALVDQAAGSVPGQVSGADLDLVEREAQRLTRERGAFRADQFANRANVAAHEQGTGPEIWRQCGGRVDAFVDLVGSGGSFVGVTRALRARNPALRAYVLEPAAAAVLAGRPIADGRHKLQGAGYARVELPLYDRGLVSDFLQVRDEDALAAARQLAAVEGVFAGYSTGAHVAAALALLAGRERGSTVVALACDSGLKYVSTDLFA